MTSAPSAETAMAAPLLGAASPAAATTAAPAVVGFQTKKPTGGPAAAAAARTHNTSSTPTVAPERMAYLEATLAKLPELDLSEMARVKTCFSSALGEGRENIVNGLELRVVLGDLGLYPSEEELKLVLRAYRDRVNLVGLARYLRLYKKEFWLNQVAARSGGQQQQQQQQQHPHATQHNAGAGGHQGRKQLIGANGNSSSPPPGTGVSHTYTAFSGSHARGAGAGGHGSGGSDEDTLRAFVALGGEEDGSGEISATTLRDAVRGFGLTIDIDAMIRTVDVHHSGMLDYVDFCALWAAPADTHSVDSMGHALRQASAEAERRGSAGDGGAGNGSAYPTSGVSRRLMTMLQTPSHRSSVIAGALHRRSIGQPSSYNGGASLPMTPRLGGNATGRSPASNDGADMQGTVAMTRPTITAASLPAPITEEEHALLVRMFLAPDQGETSSSTAAAAAGAGGTDGAGRRGVARFTLPSRAAQAATPSHAGGTALSGPGANATAGSTTASMAAAASSARRASQKQLSRSGKNGNGNGHSSSRTRSQTKRAGGSARGRRSGDHDDGGDDLTVDFFSPKNQNVYRPPSPMLLSMRNSTAYRNRVKRLEEQKHAARGGGTGDAQMQQQGGLHAATTARDGGAGGYGYGADGDSGSRPAKSATW